MTAAQRFTGKVALITGGASGIGAATAAAFAAEGASVVILDRNRDRGEDTVAKTVDRGGRADFVEGDVRDPDACRSAVSNAVERFGGLDSVFCNAGLFTGGTAETQTLDSWDDQLGVMLTGTFLTCKYAVPALRKRGGGSIALSGSNCAHIGCAGRIGYTAAKAAMPVLAKQLSNDYFATSNIRVNCVSPGYVLTPMTEQIWRDQTHAEPGETPPSTATDRWQSPASIAAAVLFLASDEAADITGITIPVSRLGLLRVAAQRMA